MVRKSQTPWRSGFPEGLPVPCANAAAGVLSSASIKSNHDGVVASAIGSRFNLVKDI